MSINRLAIGVCGIKELLQHETRSHTHVISITTPIPQDLKSLERFAPHERLSLQFHDIVDPLEGHELPQREHVLQIIAFAQSIPVDENTSILAHCYAGISRSTAAMLIVLATLYPETPADELFSRVREVRPRLWPNLLMIEYADELLGREGELLLALKSLYRSRLDEEENLRKRVLRWGRQRELAFASD